MEEGQGIKSLLETLNDIPDHIPTIADYKRADIENCGAAYARRVFDRFGFDAVTLYHYMGDEAIEAFQQPQWADRGIFVLCRTSNRGSARFQHMPTVNPSGKIVPQYLEVARVVVDELDRLGNIGLVMGATFPEELSLVRQQHPRTILLIPGVGTQGGSLPDAVKAARDGEGRGFFISVSRSIIYALTDDKSRLESESYRAFTKAARDAAKRYRDQINEALGLSPVAV
jgi:orotidine-5'-phosphate decarboxylase